MHAAGHILVLLGKPTEAELVGMGASKSALAFVRTVEPPREHGETPASRLRAACPHAEGEQEIDLLVKLLAFDPARRMRMVDALEHPFLRGMHRRGREANVCPPAPPLDMAFDTPDAQPSAAQLRALIREEVLRYQPHTPKRAAAKVVRDAPERPSSHVARRAKGLVRNRSWTDLDEDISPESYSE